MKSEIPSPNPDVICFGDSLTAGYQSPTPENPQYQETPYGDFLQSHLGPKRWVLVSGMNGELTSDMVNRFRRDVLNRSPQYVIILGGTNDLGWNRTTPDIFHNLGTMYDQAQAGGINPIAVTVPSLRPQHWMNVCSANECQSATDTEWEMIRSHIDRRLELNGRIQDYCVLRKIPVVDLFSETAEPGSQLLAPTYSNDGLHLSTKGYKRLAELLWNQIFQHRKL